MAISIVENPVTETPINGPEFILEYIRASIRLMQLRAAILEKKIIKEGSNVIQKVA